MKLLIAASMAAAASKAITIKNACLTKLDQVGNLTSGSGVAFNQQTEIYTKLDTESIPTSANVCASFENNQALTLNLFTLTMDLADGTKPVTMSKVGPQTAKETWICVDFPIATPSQLTGAAIYYSESFVTQVSLFGTSTLTIGSKADTDQVSFVQFNTADIGSFVGFHGLASEDHIEALGLITQDIACSANPDTPNNPDPNNNNSGGSSNSGSGGSGQVTKPEAEQIKKEDDGDDDDLFYIILATCAGVVVLLFVVGLIVCCCKKRNQRSTSKVEMINDPRQESEAELKDGTTTMQGPAVNASQGNGTIPIVETDEEHASNVNVRTNRIDQEKNADGNTKKDRSNDITQ